MCSNAEVAVAPDPISEKASQVLRLAKEDPARAEPLAREAVDRSREAGRPGPESVALRALGLALSARHQIPEALDHLYAAVEAAEKASDANLAAEARVSLAGVMMLAGNGEQALSTLSDAVGRGATRVLVESQRAVVLSMLGRYEEALAAYQPVILGFRRLEDKVLEGRALNNRGLLHVYLGHFAQAEADLARAEKLLLEVGNFARAATYRQNLAFAAARKGDLPTALALFEETEARLRELGVQPEARALGRATALHAAGLTLDARKVAEEAVSQFRVGGDQLYLAEGLLLLADVAHLDHDLDASQAAAEEAAQLFDRQGRRGWHCLATAAVARAALARGDQDRDLATAATSAAGYLDQMGLADQATMAHAVAGRLWLLAGEGPAGLAELGLAACRRARGTAAGRLAAWEALAVARAHRGDRRGAMAAADRALAVVEAQQASLGATELRANIAVHAGGAAALGLGLALNAKRPRSIWQWMERYRANSLRQAPARPPHDEVTAAALGELRGLADLISSCITRGDDVSTLLNRQGDLERRVRQRAWEAPGTIAKVRPARLPTPADMSAALGEKALVELAEVDGELHAVVAVGGRWYHRRLGSAEDVRRELGQAQLALGRLAYGATEAPLGRGAAEQLGRSTEILDRILLAPIVVLLGGRPVVIVSTGELHSLPWAALPSLAGRPVSVAPSSRLWLSARGGRAHRAQAYDQQGGLGRLGRSQRRHQAGDVVVVAGPGLPGAEREAARIASLYPTATVLTGAQATVSAVTAALEAASLVHLATHCTFRADNGLWSSVALVDGPLTVYELEHLGQPPRIVVLSACRSGLSVVRSGDEMMGLAAGLLKLGTEAVVACVVPVPDQATEEVMAAFHGRLVAGDAPAVALATAQSESPGTAGVSYVCFGGM
jgi:tetratricopeptide (TPR) repeat protein